MDWSRWIAKVIRKKDAAAFASSGVLATLSCILPSTLPQALMHVTLDTALAITLISTVNGYEMSLEYHFC